jgi:hypothetical protein
MINLTPVGGAIGGLPGLNAPVPDTAPANPLAPSLPPPPPSVSALPSVPLAVQRSAPITKPLKPLPTPPAVDAQSGAIPSIRERPPSARQRPRTVIVRSGQSWSEANGADAPPLSAATIRKPQQPPPPTPAARLSASPVRASAAAGAVVKPTMPPPRPPLDAAPISKPTHAPPRPTGASSPTPISPPPRTRFATMHARSFSGDEVSVAAAAPAPVQPSPATPPVPPLRSSEPPVLSRGGSGLSASSLTSDLDEPFQPALANVPEEYVPLPDMLTYDPYSAPPTVPTRVRAAEETPSADVPTYDPYSVAPVVPTRARLGSGSMIQMSGTPAPAPLQRADSSGPFQRRSVMIGGPSPLAANGGGGSDSAPPTPQTPLRSSEPGLVRPGLVSTTSTSPPPLTAGGSGGAPPPAPLRSLPPAARLERSTSSRPGAAGSPAMTAARAGVASALAGGPPIPRRLASDPSAAALLDAPFVRSRTQPSAGDAQHFDGDIDMRQFPFYHGELSSLEATKLIGDLPAGTFLVRLSSRAGAFVITWVRGADAVVHSLLVRDARGLWYMEADGAAAATFACIPDVLKSFRKTMHTPFSRQEALEKSSFAKSGSSSSLSAVVAAAGASAAATASSEQITIIFSVDQHAPMRLTVAVDVLVSDLAQKCVAFGKQRGVYFDADVQYSLHAEDGEMLPTNAPLDTLPLVRKARKKRQEPAFVLASSIGAVSSTMTVFLPNGESIALAYDGDKRIGILVSELRKLAQVAPDMPLVLCAIAPEEHETSSAEHSAAPAIEAMEEGRLLRDVACLTRARQAGLALRLALMRAPLLGNVAAAAAVASVIGRANEWLTDGNEAGAFRVAMARVRLEHVQYYGLGASTQACENGAPLPSKVMLQLALPVGKKLVAALPNETADAFIARNFPKLFAEMFPPGTQASDVVLHSPLALDFVHGPYDLATFEYVRQQCLSRGGKCDLVPALAYWSGVAQAPGDAHYDATAAAAPGAASDADAAAAERAHDSVTASALPWHAMQCISVGDIASSLRVCIVGAELPLPRFEVAQAAGVTHLRVSVGVFYGGSPLASDGDGLRLSRAVPLSEGARWNEWVDVGVAVANLPHEARLCVTLWGCVGEQTTKPIGWTNLLLFDFRHVMRRGMQLLPLWADAAANPIATCSRNEADGARAASVAIRFHEYALPVVHVSGVATAPPRGSVDVSSHVQATLEALAKADPLLPLSEDDKRVLWTHRAACAAFPRLLPKVLSSAPLRRANQAQVVAEIKQLAHTWRPFATPTDAFELLDARFADRTVRELAVAYLERLTNEDLLGYLLQLVQVLKCEPYHDSALARFLLRRALGNPVIGHHLFWYMRSEMHVGDISRRFGLLLEAYLRGAGSATRSLQRQHELVTALTAAAECIKPLKDADRLRTLRAQLQRVSDTLLAREPVDSTLDPRVKLGPLRVDKCKYMDSKKLPLWLVFSNAQGGDDVYIIFKAGDDLRQDMLTLQMIRLMDKLWQAADLDLQMLPYGCVATGDEVGMIEVVLNAETTAKITSAAGGVTAAFRSDPLLKWMEAAAAAQQVALRQLTSSFARSCAGYSVATYILGIGDRHNDNVMVRRDGRLFHIDFGHFLGNYKTKFGIKRESAPFVFTPDFARVLGGKEGAEFAQFVEFGAKAFNVLRGHAALFITLFAMMLSTGIPELEHVEDIDYLREALMLMSSEDDATKRWSELVIESLSSKKTMLNNAIHIAAH